MHNNWYVDNIEKNWFSGVTRLNYVRFCFAKKTYLKREHNVCLLVLVDLHSGLISKDEDEQSKALICKERFRRLINGWSPVTTWLLSNYCDNAVNDLSKICHGFVNQEFLHQELLGRIMFELIIGCSWCILNCCTLICQTNCRKSYGRRRKRGLYPQMAPLRDINLKKNLKKNIQCNGEVVPQIARLT